MVERYIGFAARDPVRDSSLSGRLRMSPLNGYRLAAKLGGRSTAIEKWRCSPVAEMGLFASVGRGAIIFIPTNLLTPRSSIVTP